MSKDITINVQRANGTSPVLTNIGGVQLDNRAIPNEVLYYEGVASREMFDAYITGIYDIRQTDILTEVSNANPLISSIDPVTGTNYQYRVISIPETFPDNHMEFTIDLLRGGVS